MRESYGIVTSWAEKSELFFSISVNCLLSCARSFCHLLSVRLKKTELRNVLFVMLYKGALI